MREFVKNWEWKREFSLTNDVESKWKLLKNVYCQAVSKFVPRIKAAITTDLKTKTSGKKITNNDVVRSVKRKHRLWQRYIETGDEQKYELYRKARNKAKGLVRKNYRNLIKQVAKQAKTNPKKFWAYVNSKTLYKNDIPELQFMDKGTNTILLTNGITERAEVLSEYFSSVFTIDNQTKTIPGNKYSGQIIDHAVFTEEDVFIKLNSLNSAKSPGPDSIHPRVLKELAREFSEPLSNIFNTSVNEGKTPSDWKLADITAVHKKGDKSLPENYRPISLTCVVCKVMEQLIRDKLMEHLTTNNMLSNKQFGFIKGKSTTLQLLKVLDDWTEAVELGQQTDIIYTDFQKAFDSVPHIRLLNKLSSFGIKGNIQNWIKAFLLDRKQRVKIKGHVSAWAPVISGVPQGSVLGPLLFVLYINDIVENLQCKCYLYADDMKIYTVVKSQDDIARLQLDVNEVVDWAENWLIKLNVSKCKVLSINAKNKNKSQYSINTGNNPSVLASVELEKDLGVSIDNNLSFENHISEIIQKSNKILGVIKRNFKDLNLKTFSLLYKAVVRSHLEYAQAVWSPYKLKHIDALEAVQRRATKILPSLRHLSYSERLKKLSLPTLTYRRARGDMIEVFKMVQGIYDAKSCPLLTHSSYLATRGHQHKLFKKSCHTGTRKNYFTYRIVDMWNSLPVGVINASSVNSFKNNLDKHWRDENFVFNHRANPNACYRSKDYV
jgi:hypothetical protein